MSKFVIAVGFAFLVFVSSQAVHFDQILSTKLKAPELMLWVWQQPSNLLWLDSDKIGVAYLAETILLTEDGIVSQPRMHPLRISKDQYLEAVIRIESSRGTSVVPEEKHLHSILERVRLHSNHTNVKAIQIDFDAKKSQRKFYKRLLARIKEQLPSKTTLSMTSLASWCIADRWLDDTAVDQIVPMFFRMGSDHRRVKLHLSSGGTVYKQGKELAFGFSVDEMELAKNLPKHYLSGKRVYLFPAGVWSRRKLMSLHKVESIREKFVDAI